LKIPENSKILYAELIWGGNYRYLDQNIGSELNNSVKLTLPNNQAKEIKPVDVTAAEVQESNSYVRTSGDIKDLIALSGSGKYSLSGVPSLMIKDNPYNNYVGYTLAVVYYNQNEPARNLSFFTAAEQVGADQLTNTAEVKGFATPTTGKVSGKLLVSAQEGDSMYSGDKLKFGSKPDNLVDLQGPNNNINNFFASQINNGDGNLDKTGSFGNVNQSRNTNKLGSRQGWDITGVNLSNNLSNNQNTAYARATSTGDAYLINALGIQIEVNSALPLIVLKLEPQIGDCKNNILKLAINVKNNGTATSIDGRLSQIVPEGFSLMDNSILINGNKASISNNSVEIPDLAAGASTNITYTLINDSNKNSFNQNPKFDYKYSMMSGSELISGSVDILTNNINFSQTCVPNQPPLAVNDTSFGLKNTVQNIDVLLNDTDSENQLDAKSLKIMSETSNGTVNIVDGKIQYTPNLDYVGTDAMEYQICDIQKSCDTAIVNFNIVNIKAISDEVSVNFESSAIIEVLNNDTFQSDIPDFTSLKVTKLPLAGQVVIDKTTGKITYNSNVPDVAADSFDYEICLKNTLFCSSASVKVNINQAKPTPPLANPDEAKTEQGKPVIVEVLKNDTPGNSILKTDSLILTSNPTNGVVEINLESGEVQYSPKNNFSGIDFLSYKICDLNNLCSTTTAKITVTPSPAVLGASETIKTQPKNIISEALKPLPSVLGISELVRTGGNSMIGIIVFVIMSILTAGAFIGLSLMPGDAEQPLIEEVSTISGLKK
jgi:large repetitive protein